MTPAELRERFPNATTDFIRLNADRREPKDGVRNSPVPLGGQASSPESEPAPRNEPLGKVPRTPGHPARFLIRITRRGRRLFDADGPTGKYFTDCCRYSGLIPDDSPGICKIETSQVKIGPKEEETTIVEIIPLETELSEVSA